MKNLKKEAKTKKSPFLWVPSLYLAMGLPFIALSQISVIMFADLGIDAASITFWTSLLILPYTLKPIWSPLLELYRTKKEFVVVTQLLSGICFGLIAFCLPISAFFSFSVALMAVIGLSGATHDIAADGVYLAALSKDDQAKYIGWQGAFWNLAKVLSMGGLIWLSGRLMDYFKIHSPEMATTYAWMIIMIILGGLLVFLAIYHRFALPNVKKAENGGNSFGEAMGSLWEVFKSFFTKKHILYYILFIICYRLTEGFAIKMVPLFLKAELAQGGLGLSNESIGLIYGTFGSVAFIIGSILSGYYIAHFGLKKVLFSLVCFFNIPFIIYALFAFFQPENLWIIGAGLVGEYFCYGFGFVGLTLFMMQQVAPGKHTMAYYAFASGIMNLGFMMLGMVSGWACERVGYETFFIIALCLSIPVFVLAWFIPFAHPDNKEEALLKAEEVEN